MRAAQRGVALFIGLVFLIVLSVVAVIAMRGTLTEMHMVNNVATHERLFEVSETLRNVPVALFDDHTFNRGWPSTMKGGTVPMTDFGTFPVCGSKPIGSSGVSCTVFQGITVRTDPTTGLVNLYEIPYQAGDLAYDPSTWIKNTPNGDMTISVCNSGDCTSGGTANIWVRPDGTGLAGGNAAAQAAGYRGQGNGAASGGASMYFEILSVAKADPADASSMDAMTLSQYKQRISN
jgi:hypothetical protein